jgi:hypothetical protein
MYNYMVCCFRRSLLLTIFRVILATYAVSFTDSGVLKTLSQDVAKNLAAGLEISRAE